jgi:hypothetical protein
LLTSESSSLFDQAFFLPVVISIGVVFLIGIGAGLYYYLRPHKEKNAQKSPQVVSPESKSAPGASRPHYITREFTFNAADITEEPQTQKTSSSYKGDGLFIVPASHMGPMEEALLGSSSPLPPLLHSQSSGLSVQHEDKKTVKPKKNAAANRNRLALVLSTEQYEV